MKAQDRQKKTILDDQSSCHYFIVIAYFSRAKCNIIVYFTSDYKENIDIWLVHTAWHHLTLYISKLEQLFSDGNLGRLKLENLKDLYKDKKKQFNFIKF